jgi:hypothetical protein
MAASVGRLPYIFATGRVAWFYIYLPILHMLAIYLLAIQRQWPRALCVIMILLGLLASSSARAQQWQQAVVGSGGYRVLATAADAAGNVYIAGRLIGTATFGATTLTSANAPLGSNAFVAKWSSATQGFVWAQLISSNGYGESEAIALNGSNVYVAGSVTGPATLGNFSVSGGGFVTRLTDAGTSASFAWAQPAGSDRATALVVQGTSVFVAGSFFGTQTFGPNTLVSAGSTDIFVAKLVDTGPGASYVWGQRGGSTSTDIANALAVDGANVYVTGYFYGATASFGATTLTNASNLYEVFITKLTDAGSTASFGWAQRAGGTGSDTADGIAATGGSVYVTGTFQGLAATFGSFTLAATSSTDLDIFIVKLIDAGSSSSFGWAQRVGGTGYENPTALVSNAAGVYLAGYFQSPTINFGQMPLTRIGGGDIFVARLTDTGAAGRFDWAQQAGGGTGYNYLAALSVVGRAVYTAGVVSLPVSFGGQAIAGSGNALLGYWARLFDDAAVLAATVPSRWVGVELYPNPAHASVELRLPAAGGATQATLTVLDALGRAVRRQQVPLTPAATTAKVPLLGLAPGLYHLRLQAGSQLATHALAVE